jgi:hypothetical protein
MFWTVRGANAIIALRCCPINNRFEDYWDAPSGGLISTSTSHTRAACGTDDRFMSSVNQPNSS